MAEHSARKWPTRTAAVTLASSSSFWSSVEWWSATDWPSVMGVSWLRMWLKRRERKWRRSWPKQTRPASVSSGTARRAYSNFKLVIGFLGNIWHLISWSGPNALILVLFAHGWAIEPDKMIIITIYSDQNATDYSHSYVSKISSKN